MPKDQKKKTELNQEDILKFQEEYPLVKQFLETNIMNMSDDDIADYLDKNPLFRDVLMNVKSQNDFTDISSYYSWDDPKQKERLKRLSSNDIDSLNAEYKEEFKSGKKPEVLKYISERVRKLQNIQISAQKAAIENAGKPKSVPVEQGDNIELKNVAQKGTQYTKNGCWSVSLATMLRYRGADLEQTDIRGFRPNESIEEELINANIDVAMSINDYMDLINIVLPNTMLNSMTVMTEDENEAKKNLINMVRRGLGKDNSPISILSDGHYQTIKAIENNSLHILDPLSNEEETIAIDDFLKKCKKNANNYIFEAQWLKTIEVDEENKPVIDDDNLLKQMNLPEKDREFCLLQETADYKGYQYTTAEGLTMTSVIPKKLYSIKDLENRRTKAEEEKKKHDAVVEKYNKLAKWYENRIELQKDIDIIDNCNIFKISKADVTKFAEKVSNSIIKMENLMKDKPDSVEIDDLEKYISPYKCSQLKINMIKFKNDNLEGKKSSFENTKNYVNDHIKGFEQNADIVTENPLDIRKNIIDAFEALKTTADHGKGPHDIYNRMMETMEKYKEEVYDATDNKVRAKEIRIEDVYKACAVYLDSHLEKDNSGRYSINGQFTKDGAIRKQAVVQILENMTKLPEFKNVASELAHRSQNKLGLKTSKDNVWIDFNNERLVNDLKQSLASHIKATPGQGVERPYSDLEHRKTKIQRARVQGRGL